MALVKFETNETLDKELAAIRLSRPNCNTNAACAKYAIENYISECEEHSETQARLNAAIFQLEEMKEQLRAFYSIFNSLNDLKDAPMP
jgi:type IV secretory pathway component VirB8